MNMMRSMLTEDSQNRDWDIGRVLAAAGGAVAVLGMLSYIGFGLMQVIRGTFSASEWSVGFAAMLGGLGAYMLGTGALFLLKAKGEGPAS